MTYRKKMIEVSIPLDAINAESSREKSIRHGHPSTLHLWWARRPLAACRAVIFCSLIDDPGEEGIPERELELIDALPAPDPRPLDWDKMDTVQQRRERLFAFIARLVKWENSNDDLIIGMARELIMAATDNNPPPVLDPFCGGGSIPLEAQRLGLKAYASDLNPVAVLITKALVEIPPKFADRPPVNPDSRKGTGGSATWKGAAGLADDVRYYGKWLRDQAWEKIGHLYPKGPNGETVIAWLWARTVKCPNPACGHPMPLVRSFWLSTKKGKETWVSPSVDRRNGTVTFDVKTGRPSNVALIEKGTGFVDNGKRAQSTFECLFCESGIAKGDYIDKEAARTGLGETPLAVVLEGNRTRVYQPFDLDIRVKADIDRRFENQEFVDALPHQGCRGTFASNAQGRRYGFQEFADYFTPRQLVALTTFSDLVGEARELGRQHAIEGGLPDDGVGIADGGTGAQAYADAVVTYLAFAVDKLSDYGSTICTWNVARDGVRDTFARQAIPMTWDFTEVNPFSDSSGNWMTGVEGSSAALLNIPASGFGRVVQLDAVQSIDGLGTNAAITDPPYYDNIAYADLADFFYVWLRRSLSAAYPDLFSTLLTPKGPELVAMPYRFGGDRKKADQHFEHGLAQAFERIRDRQTGDIPVSLFYAFKQAEESQSRRAHGTQLASTGWETMLSGLIGAGFEVTGTWPMRTERSGRTVGIGTNALASSILLVSRPRREGAAIATLREFNSALAAELSPALDAMIMGHIAPVDLAQSVIGPGMAVFSRYAKVVEPDGSSMTVRRALELINNAIENYMAEREGSMDQDTQFCLHWFESYAFGVGPFGQADVLARAKNVGVHALALDGVLTSGQNKVQLMGLSSYVKQVEDYDPTQDSRISAWEACHYLAAAITPPNGSEEMAGRLARRLGGLANDARDLAYRLYAICEQKGWSEEGQMYNLLADSWPAIQAAAARYAEETQAGLGL